MTVPIISSGNIIMFGTSFETIQGAIEQGGADSSEVEDFNGLISISNINLFDATYAGTVNQTSDITSSLQYQNYPQFVLTSLSCSISSSFSGNVGYPVTQPYNLTSDTGSVELQFNAANVPDRFIVYYDSSVVIDTGYRGGSDYAFGQVYRNQFTNSLVGRIDPITGNTYPFSDPSHSADNYPTIISPGTGSATFFKDSNSINSAEVEVYAPMSNTGWDLSLSCPSTPPPGSNTFETSTAGSIYVTTQVPFNLFLSNTLFSMSPNPYIDSGLTWDGNKYTPPAQLTVTGSSSDDSISFTVSGTSSHTGVFCNLTLNDGTNNYVGTTSTDGSNNIVVTFNIGPTFGRTLQLQGGELNVQF